MVVLGCPDRFEGSTYLNASVIDCLAGKAICTQAPFSNTVGQFWAMVFEQAVTLIVMLCNYEEKGRPKCCRYLPGSEPLEVEGMRITLLGEDARGRRVLVED
jgi:protein tyrosine phosphatase